MKKTCFSLSAIFVITFLLALSLPGHSAAQERVRGLPVKKALPPNVQKRQPVVVVKSASKKTVSLEAGGRMAVIFVGGEGLWLITKAQVLLNNRPIREVEARLGPVTAKGRGIMLKARSSAKPGNYRLRLIAGRQVINVPVGMVRLVVTTPKVARKMQARPLPAKGDRVSRPKQAVKPMAKPAGVAIRSVSRKRVSLEAGGGTAVIFVGGQGLERITSAQVLLNNRPVREVEVRLMRGSAASRNMTLQATANARAGNYQLRLIAGKQVINIPTRVVQIVVTAPKKVPVMAMKKPAPQPKVARKMPEKQVIAKTTQKTTKAPQKIQTLKKSASKTSVAKTSKTASKSSSSLSSLESLEKIASRKQGTGEKTEDKMDEIIKTEGVVEKLGELDQFSQILDITDKDKLTEALAKKGEQRGKGVSGQLDPRSSLTEDQMNKLGKPGRASFDESTPMRGSEGSRKTLPKLSDAKKLEERSSLGDSRVMAMGTFEYVVGKIWAAVVSATGSNPGGAGATDNAVAGVRGQCPADDMTCGVTGKTWDQMTDEERKMLCEGVEKELDKYKGADQGGTTKSACDPNGLKEPDWQKMFAERLDPYTYPTDDDAGDVEREEPELTGPEFGDPDEPEIEEDLPPLGGPTGGEPGPGGQVPGW